MTTQSAVGGAVQPVVDAADRAAEQSRSSRRSHRCATSLPPLVEVVADRHGQVLLPLGDRGVGHLLAADLGELVLRILREPVVAEVPDHAP